MNPKIISKNHISCLHHFENKLYDDYNLIPLRVHGLSVVILALELKNICHIYCHVDHLKPSSSSLSFAWH